MTNALVPHPIQACQGFSSPLAYWWYWPKFPFWTYNGKVRENRLVPYPPGWPALPERELPGNYDDRREVTYYLPTPEDIALANELFPGQGLAPPWDQVCNKLELYLPWESVYRLKCDQALALYRWVIVCERAQQQQWAQQTFVNLAAALERILKSLEPILSNYAWAIWSSTQQRLAVTVRPANPTTCSESEEILKRLLEECQRRKQAEGDRVEVERTEMDALPMLSQAATENLPATPASQSIEISPPDKATFRQSEATAPSVSHKVQDGDKSSNKSKPKGISSTEANIRAREALKNRPPRGKKRWTVRMLADAIGCSYSLVPELPAWQAYYTEWKKRHSHSVHATTMSDPVKDSLAITDQEVRRLVEEQDRDAKSRHCYIPDSL